MLRIGILTSGGDCQALNAAMRGVIKGLSVKRNDLEIYGFRDGYKGLIYDIADRMTPDDFSGILNPWRYNSWNFQTAIQKDAHP